jgi:UPF0042 nucleotide-binding protein
MIENSTDQRYHYIALSTSAQDFPEFQRGLKGEGIEVFTLFLDAADNILLHRYKSTRRVHPLLLSNQANTLEEAIDVERQMFQKYINDSVITIDTTFVTEKELKRKIESYFSKRSVPSFSISFISFGYKNGVPMDADLMIDVRFLPNPFYVEDLRKKNGLDQEVYDYVFRHEDTKTFMSKLTDLISFLLPRYIEEGKHTLTIAIGCTGGRHRSVHVAEYVALRLRAAGFSPRLDHRDLAAPPRDGTERTAGIARKGTGQTAARVKE